ncbi:hypothetical protein [Hansschlegelia plantiphila]
MLTRKRAVTLPVALATSAGRPLATMRAPASPAPGPMSITQSPAAATLMS